MVYVISIIYFNPVAKYWLLEHAVATLDTKHIVLLAGKEEIKVENRNHQQKRKVVLVGFKKLWL